MVEIGGLKLPSLLGYLGFSVVCTTKNHKENVVVKLLAESGLIRVVGGHSCEFFPLLCWVHGDPIAERIFCIPGTSGSLALHPCWSNYPLALIPALRFCVRLKTQKLYG